VALGEFGEAHHEAFHARPLVDREPVAERREVRRQGRERGHQALLALRCCAQDRPPAV
jgi:hypothetical protein